MEVSTDLSVLVGEEELRACVPAMPAALAERDVTVSDIAVEVVDAECVADNVLVREYVWKHGEKPVGLVVWRVIVNAETALALPKVTQAVAETLPAAALSYGTSEIGHTEFGLGTTLAYSASR
ncbi:hypothetical protein [Corynebacterium confusum]|uniref:hypothetical protein n=1 Tax=Corynebacterium confusum TaxID=71254 RepID=UPI0025B3BFAF|nr:hypothetical protein [Corynebacterium confusum]WJY90005.1 hypothetical protein CCONF_07415 [Corynebacterium confusum]